MMWIGAVALSACMFVTPQHNGDGLPAVDPHTFLNLTENCTCCHETQGAAKEILPHEFEVDIVENCMSCHTQEKIGYSHPVGVSATWRFPDMEVPAELPLDENGNITCGTCHNPHLDSYTTERYYPAQEPAGFRIEDGGEVAYYRSYQLRKHAPGAGNDPTCAACHAEYFQD